MYIIYIFNSGGNLNLVAFHIGVLDEFNHMNTYFDLWKTSSSNDFDKQLKSNDLLFTTFKFPVKMQNVKSYYVSF